MLENDLPENVADGEPCGLGIRLDLLGGILREPDAVGFIVLQRVHLSPARRVRAYDKPDTAT